MLRGALLTGGETRYLRHGIDGPEGAETQVSVEPLWWPPAKIVGRHLAPFLASLVGTTDPRDIQSPPGAVPSRSHSILTSSAAPH